MKRKLTLITSQITFILQYLLYARSIYDSKKSGYFYLNLLLLTFQLKSTKK